MHIVSKAVLNRVGCKAIRTNAFYTEKTVSKDGMTNVQSSIGPMTAECSPVWKGGGGHGTSSCRRQCNGRRLER